MRFLSRLFSKGRRHGRVEARLRVTIGTQEEGYWTEDVAEGGIRVNVGKQLFLSDLTGGSRDVVLHLELPGDQPASVHGESIWTKRTEDGRLETGWMFTRYDGDAKERLHAFVESHE